MLTPTGLWEEAEFGSPAWFVYAGVSVVLVVFAGLMSGLTLGLMSIGPVDLEVLQGGGTPDERRQAATILPVVQKQHQLLVTLLFCNALAMEALPLCLDMIFNPMLAILLSVTFVLFVGEVIPQAICARFGLAVGANLVWLVRILMIICYPVAYPIGKLLDCVLGHNHSALFRRAHLKAFVTIHSEEAGKGGELTQDEITIISGALDLAEKTAQEAMTPIKSTFSLDIDSILDWELMGKIIDHGHSRLPVYSGNPRNIVSVLLVRSLITVRAEDKTPLRDVPIRKIPRVPANMPLYDILNEFQKGGSHMAAVLRFKEKNSNLLPVEEEYKEHGSVIATSSSSANDIECGLDNDILEANRTSPLPEDMEGEVIGVITLEDVFEEILQEEILDEKDVKTRIRVAAVASLARTPSLLRSLSQKGTPKRHGQRQGSTPRESKSGGSLLEPLLNRGN